MMTNERLPCSVSSAPKKMIYSKILRAANTISRAMMEEEKHLLRKPINGALLSYLLKQMMGNSVISWLTCNETLL